MSKSFMDKLNETPVTYAVLLIYLTMAYLTRGFAMSPDTDGLVDYGASVGILIQDGEAWRMATHAFLHGGILHLGVNSYALLMLGPSLEKYLRTWRFIVLYLSTAIAGDVVALLLTDEATPMIGGSGALFGMLGAALALNIRGGRTLLDFLENQGSRRLIGIIAINLVIGWAIPFVSNSAHIGGLIAGFVLVFCFFDTGRRGKVDRTGRVIQLGWVLVLCSMAFYVTHPVLRFDYALKQYLSEQDPERKQVMFEYLDAYDDLADFADFARRGTPARAVRRLFAANEEEPRTGIAGVGMREWRYRQPRAPRRVIRTIRRWKSGN